MAANPDSATPPSLASQKTLVVQRDLLFSAPPERRAAVTLWVRRQNSIRHIERKSVLRGNLLRRSDARLQAEREVARLMEEKGYAPPKSRAARIEYELEMLMASLESRIAGLTSPDALGSAFACLYKPAGSQSIRYVNPAHSDLQQVIELQERVLSAFNPVRRKAEVRRLTREYEQVAAEVFMALRDPRDPLEVEGERQRDAAYAAGVEQCAKEICAEPDLAEPLSLAGRPGESKDQHRERLLDAWEAGVRPRIPADEISATRMDPVTEATLKWARLLLSRCPPERKQAVLNATMARLWAERLSQSDFKGRFPAPVSRASEVVDGGSVVPLSHREAARRRGQSFLRNLNERAGKSV